MTFNFLVSPDELWSGRQKIVTQSSKMMGVLNFVNNELNTGEEMLNCLPKPLAHEVLYSDASLKMNIVHDCNLTVKVFYITTWSGFGSHVRTAVIFNIWTQVYLCFFFFLLLFKGFLCEQKHNSHCSYAGCLVISYHIGNSFNSPQSDGVGRSLLIPTEHTPKLGFLGLYLTLYHIRFFFFLFLLQESV